MNAYRPFILLASICALHTHTLRANNQAKSLPSALENVQAVSTDSTYYVQYTNNAWRNEAEALYTVLESMLHIAPHQAWHISVATNGIPQITVQASRELVESTQHITSQFTQALDIRYSNQQNQIFNDAPVHNSSFGKTDLVLYPQFSFQNNTFERIWETQFNLAPAIEISLWKGALFTGQVIFPIHNNIISPQGNRIRPGIITLSQHYRLPHNIFGSMSIGNFNSDRMGIVVSNHWVNNSGIVQVGYSAALTGTSSVDRNGWNISKWKRISAHVKCLFTPKFYNMEAELSLGRYIYGDYGGQVTLTRRFSNAALQLFGRYTDGVSCAGLGITFPLWLRKQSRAGIFRAKVSDWYQLSYSEKSGTGADHGKGRTFGTTPSSTPMTHYLNPYYIQNQLNRLANKK
ncbi:MAG: YjbH domain-containing protein [Tannerellaceae bacterium]